MFDACKVNVSSALVKAVIDGIQRKFAIKEGSTWRSVAGDARPDAIQELEAKASPYIRLRACVGSWGANMLLDYYWSSIRRRNKKQAASGTGKRLKEKITDHPLNCLSKAKGSPKCGLTYIIRMRVLCRL
ncbi:uncharacterized protein RHIMIDRAFT_236865 [Rhizopus microsporus ATCC 52813]|uniref:Uncharacterized protein n=1 Tax=Rhizopus microsporus ATCC 52813 TaxID=1340429 RepID=A0A2G4SYK0_RHIZD|nr:uncharacterized protein RHIMIDRAFT_236865 [Rhizopus microsporus ATCC 52813]PHZ13817.1 hypothetical protein RHIMIDRAFT_236865 [Rhizopus microsporus ATCC 52813]